MLPPIVDRGRRVVFMNDWIRTRIDGVPDALARALDRELSDRPVHGTWVDRATRALDRAERETVSPDDASPGHRQEQAESLLVADALITYACEEALRHDDPDRVWAELLARIGTPAE